MTGIRSFLQKWHNTVILSTDILYMICLGCNINVW